MTDVFSVAKFVGTTCSSLILSACGAVPDSRPSERIPAKHGPVDRHRAALRNKPLLVTLAVAQIVSSRVLWPIPTQGVDAVPLSSMTSIPTSMYEVLNRVVVIDTHYNNLWAFWGSRRLFLGLLAYDIAFVALIVAWIRWVERRVVVDEPAVVLAALGALQTGAKAPPSPAVK